MNRTTQQRLRVVDHGRVLRDLTTMQHLWPHLPLQAVVEQTCHRHGLAASVGSLAIEQSSLPPMRSVGRLLRKELVGLAAGVEAIAELQIVEQVRVA